MEVETPGTSGNTPYDSITMITAQETNRNQRPPATRGAMFRTPDGVNHLATFVLVCCLFLLSALCNSMIDVLNKHFQNSLGVSKAHSAFVQAVWYGAYFFMALPP